MPKNIAFLIDSLAGGGAEKVVLALSEAMLTMGHSVTIITLKPRVDYKFMEQIRVVNLNEMTAPGWHLSKLSRWSGALQRFLDTEPEFDAIFVNLELSYQVAARCRLTNAFYVVHNAVAQTLKRAWRMGPLKYWQARKAFKALDQQRLIAVSKGLANELANIKWICPQSVEAIYNPFDIHGIRRLADEPNPDIPTTPFIVHVGRAARQKRHDLLFDALRRLPADTRLVCLSGNPGKLAKLAAQTGVSEQVVLPEFQQNPYPWMRKAQLLVLSSDYEGFGNVLVEAMLCGTQVVSTRCPHGPDEIMQGPLAAHLSTPGSALELAETIQTALQQPAKPLPETFLLSLRADNIAQQYLSLCRTPSQG